MDGNRPNGNRPNTPGRQNTNSYGAAGAGSQRYTKRMASGAVRAQAAGAQRVSGQRTSGSSVHRTAYVKPATRSSYGTAPQTGRRRPQTRRQPLWPLVVGILAAVLIVGGAAFGISRLLAGTGPGDSSSSPSTENATTTDTSTQTVEETQAETTDPGEIVIGVNGSENTIVFKGEDYLEAGAHAAEPTDGVLNNKIETSGTVDTSKTGTYTVTYRVEDSTGHVATIDRTVTVVDSSTEKQKTGVPVLMYHEVHAEGDGETHDANDISDADLAEQLAYLTENNFYFASFQEVKAFVEGTHSLPAKSIVLTFDDASPGFLQHGIPVLEKYQVPATSFCIGMYDEGNSVGCRSRYVEYESHSYKMHQAGGTSGHGGLMTAMTTDQIVEDLQKEADILQANNAFAYPFGDVPEAGVAAVKKAGIACGFTTVNGWAKIGDDTAQLSRVRVNAGVSLDSYASMVTNP